MQLLFFVKILCEYDFFFFIPRVRHFSHGSKTGEWCWRKLERTRSVSEMDWELVTSLQNTTHPTLTPAPKF